jgi:MinD superfamily P-loop ATPase
LQDRRGDKKIKQLLILSGKGGTGKTTVAAAFIKLSEAKAFADCDVDAPNLHLIHKMKTESVNTDFYGLPKAEIDQCLCTKCSVCKNNCHFDAVSLKNDTFQIDSFSCEGCGLCALLCPSMAIKMNPAVSGELNLFTDDKVFSTAKLKIGSGNSGKLVSAVKKNLNDSFIKGEISIVDGSPGIGCPVIASMSGADMILIVTEPSLSGISDMERIIKTAGIFQSKIAVCVNKFDTNIENSIKIEEFCRQNNIVFTGRIPYDPMALKAVNNGISVVEIESESGSAIKNIFNKVHKILVDE